MLLGGVEVVDLRRPYELQQWPAIGNVVGISVHHTVSDFDDDPSNDWDAIAAILRYHEKTRGWPGIGYHLLIGDNGAIYYVGDLATERAHVKGRNHELWSFALLGSYSDAFPPPGQIEGAVKAVRLLQNVAGNPELPWGGHKLWAPSAYPSECPGDNWGTYKQDIAEGLAVGNHEATQEAIRHAIMMDRARLGLIERLANREDKDAIQNVVNWAAAWLNIRETVPKP